MGGVENTKKTRFNGLVKDFSLLALIIACGISIATYIHTQGF